jgi:hypothetical protein
VSPFIVTVRRPTVEVEGGAWAGAGVSSVSRRAVATLEEATAAAERAVRNWRDKVGTREAWDCAYAPLSTAANLSEAGGAVGPLPDGTVIEVERLSPLMLGSRCRASGELMMGCLRDDDWSPLVAAFNAREAGTE